MRGGQLAGRQRVFRVAEVGTAAGGEALGARYLGKPALAGGEAAAWDELTC
ncbi:hypothetical protein OG216_39430 [Streptomycetaceae bacterium NBC_01309]